MPAGVSAPIPPNSAPTKQAAATTDVVEGAVVDPRPDTAPPHNPATGEVVEQAPPGGVDGAQVLLEAIAAIKAGPEASKQLDELRNQVDAVAPKGHAKRAEIARLINAKRAELQGAR